MKNLTAQHPELVEDRLTPRASHSAHHPAPVEDRLPLRAGHSAHLRVFPRGLVLSPVVTQGFLVAILSVAVSPVAVLAAAVVFPAAIPLVAVSLVVAEAADKSQNKQPQGEDHLILSFLFFLILIIFGCKRRVPLNS